MKHAAWLVIAAPPWSLVVFQVWRWINASSATEEREQLAKRMRQEQARLDSLADLPEPIGRPVKRRALEGPGSKYTQTFERS